MYGNFSFDQGVFSIETHTNDTQNTNSFFLFKINDQLSVNLWTRENSGREWKRGKLVVCYVVC